MSEARINSMEAEEIRTDTVVDTAVSPVNPRIASQVHEENAPQQLASGAYITPNEGTPILRPVREGEEDSSDEEDDENSIDLSDEEVDLNVNSKGGYFLIKGNRFLLLALFLVVCCAGGATAGALACCKGKNVNRSLSQNEENKNQVDGNKGGQNGGNASGNAGPPPGGAGSATTLSDKDHALAKKYANIWRQNMRKAPSPTEDPKSPSPIEVKPSLVDVVAEVQHGKKGSQAKRFRQVRKEQQDLKAALDASKSADDVKDDKLWGATAAVLKREYKLTKKDLKAGVTLEQRKKKSEQELKAEIINVQLKKYGLDVAQEKKLWTRIHTEFHARTNGKDLKSYYTK